MKNYLIAAVVIALLANQARHLVELGGIFQTIHPLNTEQCHTIEGKYSPEDFRNCEDIVMSPHEAGIAYTACDPARDHKNMVMDVHRPVPHPEPGDIWRVDYVQGTATRFATLGDDDFHPLGLAIVDASLMMVINLRHHAHAAIELFSLQDAKHIRTLEHPQIYTPNSIHILDGRSAADGTPSFFFSNDHYFRTGIMKKIENYASLPLANIMFYDAPTHTVYPVAQGLSFANGLAGDHKSVLFAAETYRMTVKRFEIVVDETQVRLQQTDHIKVPSMVVDNTHYDEKTGNVLVAGHPVGLDLLKFARNVDASKTKRPPSRVVAWHPHTKQVDDVFVDDGTLYPTSSTAFIDHDAQKLVISGLYARGILVCDHQQQ
ncbi:hypothetical protein BDB00DRAFT_868044 [Zychaea mexicana]|uniref:uncharacterized protein n=1 Tax=Zychaea mexicana TaxID=64656 RepID=UPI0022FDBA7C|nr:uncharacterized protein BDB00DRAFT_868044 [Zychaea mexicana]KAI9497917.1 hypothetical protein BDB00DRAFT_868044 [Zychaea mexicana]